MVSYFETSVFSTDYSYFLFFFDIFCQKHGKCGVRVVLCILYSDLFGWNDYIDKYFVNSYCYIILKYSKHVVTCIFFLKNL